MGAGARVERLHSQDLNKRASNVDARSKVGQSSLKPTIYLKILKFWLHLEELPENSIAKQCLIMSKELANTAKHSSISSANQIRSQVRNKDTVATGLDDIQETITKLEISKLTSNILEVAKTHQSNLIQINKKLKFYSLFKQDNKKSLYLDLIKKKPVHRRTIAELRTSNHRLMIEYGRYCRLKSLVI